LARFSSQNSQDGGGRTLTIVVALWKNPDPAKHGHIAVVRPYADQPFTAEKGPRITQFGARNKKDVYAAETFGKKLADTKFFAQMK
jgi:hypothetical protein